LADDDRVRENRLRRMAERQGLRLLKSRRRDPYADGYGTYMLVEATAVDPTSNGSGPGYGFDLDAIEQQLKNSGP
jgi:hypothetical protein